MSSRAPSATCHPFSGPPTDIDSVASVLPPTRLELIAALKRPSVGGAIKQKIDTLQRAIFTHRVELSRLLTTFLPQIDPVHLLPAAGLPKKPTGEYMAVLFFDWHHALSMLKGVCGDVGGRTTRMDMRIMEEVVEPAWMQLDMMVQRATIELNDEKVDVARSSMVKLTDAERNRRFLQDGATLPVDEMMRHCPYCGCKGTVDVPAENVGRMRRNEIKLEEHRRAKEAWEVQKASGALMERTGTRGNLCGRAPKLPAMERLPWVCHCHQFRNPNPQRPNNTTTSCPIKCCNPEGEVYAYDPIKRKVTCPACLCNCSAAFEVRAMFYMNIISYSASNKLSISCNATRI